MGQMLSDKEILIKAFKSGLHFHPNMPNLHNLDLDRVSKMDGSEADAKDLIRSFQASDINLDILSLSEHGRLPNFDGNIGPATRALASLDRCAMPDFAPPPGATFDTGNPELNKAIESQQRYVELLHAEAMGTGSWPSCDPQRPGVNSFRVNLNTERCPTTIKNYLQKALEACVECYAEVGFAVRYILDGDPNESEISKRFESLGGSVIGWNEFPSPNTCNQVIEGRLDTGYAPSDWRYWANLEIHETGHGVGLNHTRGHIMNPSILLVWRDSPKPNISWKGGPSESTISRYAGGLPIPVVAGPGPTVPNPPISGSAYAETKDGNIVLRGTFDLDIPDNHPKGKYRYTFVPVSPGAKEYKLEKAASI